MLEIAARTVIEKKSMGDIEQVTLPTTERHSSVFLQRMIFFVGCTLFTHRNIYKLAWTLHDGKIKSQAAHILLSTAREDPLPFSLPQQGVQMMRQSDVGSDRSMQVAKLVLKPGHSQDLPIKAEGSTTVNEKQSQLERWRAHFHRSLGQLDPQALALH